MGNKRSVDSDHTYITLLFIFLSFFQLAASSSDLAAALQLSMRAVQHENVDVRIHALTSLRDMMHSNQVHTQ